ncbi:ABC transporter permease [Mycolicibacterium moriokaense]|nr:ABC transporter permease [Mycolicibacterium moriokaense]
MIATWTLGLLRRRSGRMAATTVGIAAAVALLTCLGVFLSSAQESMTARATRSVAVDWQVEVAPQAQPSAVMHAVRSTPHVRAALPVGFGRSSGLSASGGGSTRTTGPAVVLGIPAGYRQQWPGEMRTLVGSERGVLVAQQTAANLNLAPGDTVAIGRAGMPPADVRVDGIVELPQADSLFQKIGAPPGAQPAAPPDNVLVLPDAQWRAVFDPLAGGRPDLVSTQIHVALGHDLPSDPATAYARVAGAARNLEARSVGGAVVGDNLGAALDAARGDAAYARILFLFLGLPAVAVAVALTAALVGSGALRRRREQALLRARGAGTADLLRLSAAEAALVGVLGSALGVGVAAVLGAITFGSGSLGASATSLKWAAAAAAAGLAIAAVTVLAPAWRELRHSSVASGRTRQDSTHRPLWMRTGLDIVLLCVAVVLFWQSSRNGYQIVLAPEGVPSISVSYWAFVAPALFWIGGALLVWRLSDVLMGRGRGLVARGLRPLTGGLSGPLSRSLSRQRRPIATAIVVLAATIGFAASTATFNATYQAQAEVDAKLTNGADVTVTESPGATVPASMAKDLAAVPGVHSVEPIQHRFAYIGTDLQDLYGVHPGRIAAVTALQDTYFIGGTAEQLMNKLARQPDSILVSAETVKDFQLNVGDTINLRLPKGDTHELGTVRFTYAGIVSEFPTAPKDSFFVANADYIAQQTGNDAVGAFLIDTGGRNTTAVAQRVQALVGPTAKVTDIADTRGTVGSSLTAVDLAGLTRIELGFGLVLAGAAGALVLLLRFAERRRTLAIAKALGATRAQLRSFVVVEACVLALCGVVGGAALGALLSQVLVKALTGVFDPPPAVLAVPWPYLVGTVSAAIITIAAMSWAIARLAGRTPANVLREL